LYPLLTVLPRKGYRVFLWLDSFQFAGANGADGIGMPTMLLVDPNGCEIASLSGPAEWASADGLKLLNAALQW
jgi:hypothetical protein